MNVDRRSTTSRLRVSEASFSEDGDNHARSSIWHARGGCPTSQACRFNLENRATPSSQYTRGREPPQRHISLLRVGIHSTIRCLVHQITPNDCPLCCARAAKDEQAHPSRAELPSNKPCFSTEGKRADRSAISASTALTVARSTMTSFRS